MNYLLAIIVALAFVFIISKLFYKEKEGIATKTRPDRELMEDMNLLSAIDNIKTAEELMNIVLENDEFYGEENNALLRKALSFGSEICRHDWVDIYNSAQEDSMLEKIAEEKAGRALDEEI